MNAPHAGGATATRTLATLAVAYLLSRLWLKSDGSFASRSSIAATGRPAFPEPSARISADGEADAPTDIPPRDWWDIARGLHARIGEDRIMAVAAGVTFYGLLAVFPAIAAMVSIFGLVADPARISDQLATLSGVLPGGALDIVGNQVERIANEPTALGFGFVFGLGTSLWSSNAGMKAIFDALNVAYGEHERRSFIRLNLVSLCFTLASLVVVVALLGAVVVMPVAFKFFGFEGLGSWLLFLGRWPAMLLVVLGGLAVLYRFGPDREEPRWRWVTPGSLVAGIGWMIFSAAFTWYVASFGSYNETYGSLGAAIGFMTWIWLSTTIVLVGAELNAEIERTADGSAVERSSGR